MKNKILPFCLQGNYGDSLVELSNTSYSERFNEKLYLKKWKHMTVYNAWRVLSEHS